MEFTDVAPVRQTYVPVENEILSVDNYSAQELCNAFAQVLTRLGHANVHAYVSEFGSADATDPHERAYQAEVLSAMVRDIDYMSPESLTFGMAWFEYHGGIYLGWLPRS